MIDALASLPQYLAHIAPVMAALPDELRGEILERPCPGGAILVASYADHFAARKTNRRPIIVMEHGIGQSYSNGHSAYPGGLDRGDVALFLVPNEHAARRWRAEYPRIPVVIVGSPRLDDLPRREPGPPAIAITFHWDSRVVPETRSTLSHYRSGLPELAAAYPLLGHAHPRNALRAGKRVYERLGIEYVADFDEVCRRADLLIADNTSALFEFASTGRPVVVMNAPWYRRDVDHGLRFWSAADVGLQVDEPHKLVAGVAAALEDPAERRSARNGALALVYPVRSGSARLAVDAIAATLEEIAA